MLQINILSQFGNSDVSVTTLDRENQSDRGWVNPDEAFASVRYRNVAMFPLRLRNGGSTAVIGPSVSANPELFFNSIYHPATPILKNFVRVSVLDDLDDPIREMVLSVPFYGLVKNGVVRLEPNEEVFCGNSCWVDKRGIPNANTTVPMDQRRIYGVFIEFDQANVSPGLYCNISVPAMFYTYQVRHSQSLYIP